MKHITKTSKIRPVQAGCDCFDFEEILDKVACVVDPELAKCEEIPG